MTDDRVRAFVRFGWVTLAVTVVVIVWGGVVRATGSGAGCGSHWPLCNGVVVPLAPATSTLIEFVHRVTSGGAMILSLVLLVWARRLFPAGHRARSWAMAQFVLMLVEAAIGAGIVLLGLVEDNASALRAGYVGGHLVNTMFLVAAMTATVHESQKLKVESRKEVTSRKAKLRAVALVLMIIVAASGAVVALGDTLFPSASLAEGFAADLDPTSHFLIRLRVWHPILAVAAGVLTIAAFRAPFVTTLVLMQAGLGVLNLLTLAPLPLQMIHLFGSNVLWMAMVWTMMDDDG